MVLVGMPRTVINGMIFGNEKLSYINNWYFYKQFIKQISERMISLTQTSVFHTKIYSHYSETDFLIKGFINY